MGSAESSPVDGASHSRASSTGHADGLTEKEDTFMADDTTTAVEATPAEQEAAKPEQAWQPPQSQADFDRIIEARLARQAKQFEGFEDAKAKAAKYDELEESKKSEQQKLTEQLQALQQERDQLKGQALRASVAADKGVPASLLSGSSQEELEASADALLAFRGKQTGPVVPADGTASSTQVGSSDWIRNALKNR